MSAPVATGSEALTARGISECRGCNSSRLKSVLDLGNQPIANELALHGEGHDQSFPLHLRVCQACGLGQVGEFVLPDRLFADYPYLSSVSTSWVQHAKRYAEQSCRNLALTSADYVLEVASNDGYLLRQFRTHGIRVLGVEPAANVAALTRADDIDTVNAFFGRDVAGQILAERRNPRLVVANNVMAHVPDLDDFVGGLAVLAGPNTVISVENPSFVTLLEQTQFDTVYHEHFSYLSAHAVAAIVARHGLQLFDIDQLPTHGGSNRYWICASGAQPVRPAVQAAIGAELSDGLLNPLSWARFRDCSARIIEQLSEWLGRNRQAGVRVAAYGAAAKGNTLLNAAGASAHDLVAVVDGSVEKQGKYLPGSRVPIVAPNALAELDPAEVLILPWNIAAELVPIIATLAPRARPWAAIPHLRELTP